MPHITIEHSANFSAKDIKDLGKNIINTMSKITEGNFSKDQCKARGQSFANFTIGDFDESNSTFLHITVKILEGRSAEVRQKLSQQILELTQNSFKDKFTAQRNDISVDVVEMEKETYRKLTLNN